MANTRKETMVQVFDKYIDREYYKLVKGFFFMSDVLVRTDRLKDSRVLKIETESIPDEIFINHVEYKLVKK